MVVGGAELSFQMIKDISLQRAMATLAQGIQVSPTSITSTDVKEMESSLEQYTTGASICGKSYKTRAEATALCTSGTWQPLPTWADYKNEPYYVAIRGYLVSNSFTPLMDKLIGDIEKTNIIKITPVPGIPPDAVMAFDLNDCPAGWSKYTAADGRSIIGTGFSGTGQLPDAHTLREKGGLEKHQMSLTELVPHNHVFWRYSGSSPYEIEIHQTDNGGSSEGSGDIEQTRNNAQDKLIRISNTGGDPATGQAKPFDITDPYIALTYCKKE